MAAIEFHCEVTGFKQLTPTVFETCFTTDKPVHFEAGQFISIVIPGAGPRGRDLRRAYSIASGPEQRPVELCVKLVEGGPGTNYLYKLRPGDKFRGFAPYGDFTYEPCAGNDAIFISTGTGIAPFRSMIFSKAYSENPPRNTVLLLGVREENEVLYDDEMQKVKDLTWVPCVSRPTGNWHGFKGRVTDWLRATHQIAWKETQFYLCGAGAMIDEVKALLADKGVAKECIHQEVYYKTPKGDGISSTVTGT
jgi:CDP-4-dehydro-6-deoxyglucose reductase